MSETNKSNNYKKRLLVALEKSLGVVSTACKKAKLSRKTFYEYCKEDADFKAAVDDIQDVALDFAESRLFKSIADGSDTATIFYLKTKGKKRGYIERQEVENSGKVTHELQATKFSIKCRVNKED
jgi:hypothetical protein